MDWLYLLFLLCAYALIPAVPAALLRIKAPVTAHKLLAVLGTVLGIFCLGIIIFIGEDTLSQYEILSTFAQCVLVSSAPVLYCAAFIGHGKQVWIAALPSAAYFLSFFMRSAVVSGFLNMVTDVLEFFTVLGQVGLPFDSPIVFAFLMSFIFFIWAVLCIYAAKIIYRFAQRIDDKLKEKQRQNKRRRL
jgi:hypothetical protein